MYDAGYRHYYIDEVARLKSGDFVIPVRWLEDNDGNVFADGYAIAFDDQVGFSARIVIDPNVDRYSQLLANVIDSNVILIRASDLQDNFLDLMDSDLIPAWNGELHIVIYIVGSAHNDQ
jgi:hypothetical protein